MAGRARGFCWGLIGLFAALPRAAAVELDIPVFAGGYGLSFYEETARQFEEKRPGVKVRLYGDPRIGDKISVRVIAGNLPDTALAAYVPWSQLARAGKVLDLAKYLDGPNWENDGRWRDSFLPGALDTWRIDGRVYGLPFTYACWTIFYNRALFRDHGWDAPRTWDEFFNLCDKIKDTGIAPLSLAGTRGLYPDAFLRSAYYNLAGAESWRALQELTPGARLDPRYIRAAGVLQRITQKYALRGWDGASHTGAQVAFLEGRAAMTVSGSWMINEMEGKIPASFELGAMNFPVFPEGVADPGTIQAQSDCFFLFLNRVPERERLAVDFLRFLTSRERAEAFVRRANAPVAVRGVPRSAYSPRMQDTVAMIEHAKGAFNMPQVMMQPPAVRQALTDERFRLMTGAITPQEFGQRLEAAAVNDRARAANPALVEFRHRFAGTVLLGTLGAAGIWLARGQLGKIRLGTRPSKRSDGDSEVTALAAANAGESYFARLRAPFAFVFVGPAFALYAALVLLPGLAAFAWAFTRWDGLGARTWSGLFNFKWLLFEDNTFWSALGNNLYLMAVPALIVVPLALLFAALLHRGVWGGNVFRGIFLFPNMLGGIAATLLWLNAYEPNGGLVNATLVALGRALNVAWLQSFDGFPWLAQSHLYTALIPIYLWMACGFNLILYLAAMEGIDPQLYEAAELDGASVGHQFFSITLPLIWEAVVISVVFIVISGLNSFEMVWLLTSQDPDSASHTLGTLMVTTMFKDFAIGRAATLAVVLFALVLAASVTVLRGLKREAVE